MFPRARSICLHMAHIPQNLSIDTQNGSRHFSPLSGCVIINHPFALTYSNPGINIGVAWYHLQAMFERVQGPQERHWAEHCKLQGITAQAHAVQDAWRPRKKATNSANHAVRPQLSSTNIVFHSNPVKQQNWAREWYPRARVFGLRFDHASDWN